MQGDSALGRALALVRDLRTRCPWDGAQTPQTLRPYLVEEALELDHAIQSDDPEALKDELGDVLLHLAFQIVIAEERSQFNAEVVTRSLEEKMWRRHPHLYAGAQGSDHAKWGMVKRREPRAGGKRGTLAGLPPTLPPLLAAYRLQERAHLGPHANASGNNPYDAYGLEGACLLVVGPHDLHQVPSCPGNPQHGAVTGDALGGRDARDRYFGAAPRMPCLDLAAAPDP